MGTVTSTPAEAAPATVAPTTTTVPPPPYPAACATALPDGQQPPHDDWTAEPLEDTGLSMVAFADATDLIVATAGGRRTFLNGVNLGSSLPGFGPNDLPGGPRTYTSWIRGIGAMGFRSVRTYALHPPAFYEALAAYNSEHTSAPIYLVQGVWIPEAEIAEAGVLSDPVVTEAMDADIAEAIRTLTGAGSSDADVTSWLAGVVIGVEWDPALVAATDATVLGDPAGEFIRADSGATTTERWLATRMDTAAATLAEAGVAAPLSFINWTPTDPLDHTRYPNIATIDPNRVVSTDAWPAGVFATYHAYPYAPTTLLAQEPGIADYHRGADTDPYAGYLAALRRHHPDLPVVIGEVGIPGGWAPAGPDFGTRTYGGHLESTQMQTTARLVDLIAEMDLSGAWVFEWTDEWFKQSWNMVELDPLAATRSNWHNLLSVEQHFGVMAVEATPAALLDGSVDDWDDRDVITDGDELEVSVTSDASSLYLMIQGPLPDTLDIRLDTDPTLRHWDDPVDSFGDVAVVVDVDQAAVFERTAYALPDSDVATVGAGDTGVWTPYSIVTDLGTAGRQPSGWGLSGLRRSNGDGVGTVPPNEAGWARSRNVVEVRMPWTLLGVADPSTASTLRFTSGPSISTTTDIGISVVADEVAIEGEYELEPWDEPLYRERLKQGSGALAAALCRTSYGP